MGMEQHLPAHEFASLLEDSYLELATAGIDPKCVCGRSRPGPKLALLRSSCRYVAGGSVLGKTNQYFDIIQALIHNPQSFTARATAS
jgi:hypothetical protein